MKLVRAKEIKGFSSYFAPLYKKKTTATSTSDHSLPIFHSNHLMAEFPLARDRHQQRDSEININKFVIIPSIPLDKFVDLPLILKVGELRRI